MVLEYMNSPEDCTVSPSSLTYTQKTKFVDLLGGSGLKRCSLICCLLLYYLYANLQLFTCLT